MKSVILALSFMLAISTFAEDTLNKEEVYKVSWGKYCAFCHGKDGKGTTTIGRKMRAKDLTSAEVREKYQDEAKLIKLISDGYTKNGRKIMRPLKNKLSEAEIKALAKQLLSLKKK